MNINQNTAFIFRNPDHVDEAFNQLGETGLNFHIYLIGNYKTKPHPRVTIINAENTRQIAGMIASDMTRKRLAHICCTDADIETKDKILELQTIDSSFALNGGSIAAMENIWTNLPKIRGNYVLEDIAGAFKGKPVIVVSSGPSLNKQLPLLRELQNRCVLVACSSSLAVLKTNGIVPHFCIALDPFALSHDLLINHLDERTILVSALMLHHDLVEEAPGKKLFFLGEYDTRILLDTIKVIGMKQVLATNSTITVSAFAFAYLLGGDPIIMIGQDMCYSDEGDEHSGDLDKQFDKNLYPVEFKATDGRTVKSCLAYKEVFDYFGAMIPTIKDRLIVNATEGGAGIMGALEMSLADAADKYMSGVVTMPDLPDHKINALKYNKYLNEQLSNLRTIKCKVDGFIKKLEPIIDDPEQENALRDKIDRWMDKIRILPSYNLLETFMLWCWHWGTTTPDMMRRKMMLANLAALLTKLIDLIEKARI